ncbi:MAG: hypothetical protein NTV93_07410 [Verrucomicrobia bacterium]|nr:hypothetical protein [Verrucomicrobiota bacterium]
MNKINVAVLGLGGMGGSHAEAVKETMKLCFAAERSEDQNRVVDLEEYA